MLDESSSFLSSENKATSLLKLLYSNVLMHPCMLMVSSVR